MARDDPLKLPKSLASPLRHVFEYCLMVFPVALGGGKRLFGELGAAAPLGLTESKPAGETLILIYEPAAA